MDKLFLSESNQTSQVNVRAPNGPYLVGGLNDHFMTCYNACSHKQTFKSNKACSCTKDLNQLNNYVQLSNTCSIHLAERQQYFNYPDLCNRRVVNNILKIIKHKIELNIKLSRNCTARGSDTGLVRVGPAKV